MDILKYRWAWITIYHDIKEYRYKPRLDYSAKVSFLSTKEEKLSIVQSPVSHTLQKSWSTKGKQQSDVKVYILTKREMINNPVVLQQKSGQRIQQRQNDKDP